MINSAEEFVALRTSESVEEYTRAAQEPAPIGVWSQVIEHFPDMRFWVAHNKTVPVEILSILANDEDSRVRHMVASKRKATHEILALLAADSHSEVRLAVANNRSTPRLILEQLCQDHWERIVEVATNRLLTE